MMGLTQEAIIDYTNHEGVRAERRIIPISIRYGRNTFHEEDQWFLCAKALDRNSAFREFAMKDIHSWKSP